MLKTILKPFERLARVFDTREKEARLMRRFGVGRALIDRWLREHDGLGSGHPSPLDRARDLIDEAWIVDPTGAGAELIAADSYKYNETIKMSRTEVTAYWSGPTEALELLKEANDVIQRLGRIDLVNLDHEKCKALYIDIVELSMKTERIKALVTTVMHESDPDGEVEDAVTFSRPMPVGKRVS